jgi:hypothetical protein
LDAELVVELSGDEVAATCEQDATAAAMPQHNTSAVNRDIAIRMTRRIGRGSHASGDRAACIMRICLPQRDSVVRINDSSPRGPTMQNFKRPLIVD